MRNVHPTEPVINLNAPILVQELAELEQDAKSLITIQFVVVLKVSLEIHLLAATKFHVSSVSTKVFVLFYYYLY